MKSNPPWFEIVERARNFRWNIKKIEENIDGNESYFISLFAFKKEIVIKSSMDIMKKLSKTELLITTFSEIYNFEANQQLSFDLLFDSTAFQSDVYEACFFSALCTFLHTSKRIKGKSYQKFVYDNHPMNFDDPNSPNYRSPNLATSEADKLRKERNRLLMRGKVYIKNSQWSAVTKDLEYELTFHYAIENSDKAVQDTYKRMRNLYNDVDKALDSNKDDGYSDRLRNVYKKFLSKLRKIKYENVLKLYQRIFSHIDGNRAYYGLNIYRFEKRMRPFNTINEVKYLHACQSAKDEVDFLMKTVALKDICFPKIYKKFLTFPFSCIESYVSEFSGFYKDIVCSSCLIMDELIEKGVFGDDWENLFRNTINEMTESVFYDPSKLDFTTTAESQNEFEALLAASVFTVLCDAADMPFEFEVT